MKTCLTTIVAALVVTPGSLSGAELVLKAVERTDTTQSRNAFYGGNREPLLPSPLVGLLFGTQANLFAPIHPPVPGELLSTPDGKPGFLAPDFMPNMSILFALRSYYEYSGDKRIIDMMTRSFYWLYNITGDLT